MASKYLIIAPSWVGDMVMAQSLFRFLKDQEPDCVIDVLAPKSSLPMAQFMPEVNEKILFDFKHGEFSFFKRRKFAKSLKRKQYTHSIVLPNSWKSALVPFFIGIHKRIGFVGESRYLLLNDVRKLDKQKLPLMIDRFCALAVPNNQDLPNRLPYPKFVANTEEKNLLMQRLNFNTSKKIIGFCPGAEFGPAKKWPTRSYASLADKLIELGFQIWLFGGPNDKNTTQDIIDHSSHDNKQINIVDFAGKTSLVDAVNIMDCCDYIISNDTGLMHIANALCKKTLVIYGSSSDNFTPPLNEQSVSIYLEDLECRPCFKRTCPLEHMNCLNQLSTEQVFNKFSATFLQADK
ncbi:lipopolysaccharide heptosyltransferase II [Francisellaceae bacterium]|nr:lipopolysaccharide heptosyltransferase II [Francisellaceae bacterium]